MFFVLGLLTLLVPVALLAAIVVAVVRAVRRRDPELPAEEPATIVRRLFVYGLLFAALIITVVGVQLLLTEAFGDRQRFTGGADDAALALTFLIVGAPTFFLLLRSVLGRMKEDVEEARSSGWTLYLAAALVSTLVGAMTGVGGVAGLISGADQIDAGIVAVAIPWTAAWLFHAFWLVRRHPPYGDIHMALQSFVTLVASAVGVIILLAVVLGRAYDAATSRAFFAGADPFRIALMWLVAGVPAWIYLWWTRYRVAERTVVWHSYVTLAGIFVWIITAVSVIVGILSLFTLWWFGEPVDRAGADHFEALAPMAATALVALGVWWHHRTTLRARGAVERSEPIRVYEYGMAAIGLLASASGIAAVLVAMFQALGPTRFADTAAGRNTLVVALTILAVAAPLWWWFWRRVQHHAASDPRTELSSPARRGYLFLLFGIGAVVAFISLLVALARILGDLLDGEFGRATIRDVRFSLAIFLATAVVAWPHWLVFRSDREALGERVDGAKRAVQVVLVTARDELGRELAGGLGSSVTVWRRVGGPPPGEVDVESLVDAIEAAGHDRVLVVEDPTGYQVIPFDRQ